MGGLIDDTWESVREGKMAGVGSKRRLTLEKCTVNRTSGSQKCTGLGGVSGAVSNLEATGGTCQNVLGVTVQAETAKRRILTTTKKLTKGTRPMYIA